MDFNVCMLSSVDSITQLILIDFDHARSFGIYCIMHVSLIDDGSEIESIMCNLSCSRQHVIKF
jgi:hypothetical protein